MLISVYFIILKYTVYVDDMPIKKQTNLDMCMHDVQNKIQYMCVCIYMNI